MQKSMERYKTIKEGFFFFSTPWVEKAQGDSVKKPSQVDCKYRQSSMFFSEILKFGITQIRLNPHFCHLIIMWDLGKLIISISLSSLNCIIRKIHLIVDED